MIIDCHGHYTTAPAQHEAWRRQQIEAHNAGRSAPPRPAISDDEIRASIVNGQLQATARARHRRHDLLAQGRGDGASFGRREDE